MVYAVWVWSILCGYRNIENTGLLVSRIFTLNIEVFGHHIELGFKMMHNVMYGGKSNDLKKYCEWANCQKQVAYSQVKTGGNDPSISKRMRYSQYVRNYSGCVKALDSCGNVVG